MISKQLTFYSFPCAHIKCTFSEQQNICFCNKSLPAIQFCFCFRHRCFQEYSATIDANKNIIHKNRCKTNAFQNWKVGKELELSFREGMSFEGIKSLLILYNKKCIKQTSRNNWVEFKMLSNKMLLNLL